MESITFSYTPLTSTVFESGMKYKYTITVNNRRNRSSIINYRFGYGCFIDGGSNMDKETLNIIAPVWFL